MINSQIADRLREAADLLEQQLANPFRVRASDHEREGQRTVVTETRGPLQGRRVVRGREAECCERAAEREGNVGGSTQRNGST